MRTEYMRRVLLPSAALLVLALALMLAGLGLTAGAAQAAPAAKATPGAVAVQTRDVILEFGDPVTIPANERVEAVVSFGGDVTVAGTVTSTIVAFGGDVRILPSANVGSGLTSRQDASVVAMGGTITVEDGAQVSGTLERVNEGDWSELLNVDVPTPTYRWGGFSFLGWLVQTAVFLVLGLVAAALLPKQMLAVGRTLAARPGGSLGWGALVFFIIVPAAAIVLAISIIGILVLIPAFVVVPLFYFFAALSVAALVAQRLLLKGRQHSLMLATALGVVGTTIISQIPFGGALAVLAMTLFGTGAATLALIDWRKGRRPLRAPAPAGGPTGGQEYGPYAPAPYAMAPQAPPASPAASGDAVAGAPLAAGAVGATAVTAVAAPSAGEAPTVVTPPAGVEAPTAVTPPAGLETPTVVEPAPAAVTVAPGAPVEAPAAEAPASEPPAADLPAGGESGPVVPPAAVPPAPESEGPPRRRFGRGSR